MQYCVLNAKYAQITQNEDLKKKSSLNWYFLFQTGIWVKLAEQTFLLNKYIKSHKGTALLDVFKILFPPKSRLVPSFVDSFISFFFKRLLSYHKLYTSFKFLWQIKTKVITGACTELDIISCMHLAYVLNSWNVPGKPYDFRFLTKCQM